MPSPPALATRQALLDAAVELFLTQGVDATSMDQVRSAAGASNGSLYHHFPTRNHLARTIYEAALRDYQAKLHAALRQRFSAEQGVKNLVKHHIAWVQRSPQQARVLHELRASTAIEGHEPDWEQVNAAAYSSIKAWIARHVAEGTMQDLPFEIWMALVFGPVLQLTSRWARADGVRVPARVIGALAQAAWRSVRTAGD